MKRTLAVALLLTTFVTGCAKKKRVNAPVAAPRAVAAMPHIGDEEVGVASWYGYPYHGRRSSNGEIYDMDKLTAAHRTMPFGTIVRVTNLTNDREVEVRITDRGPFVDGRIIDLSRAAAREIQMVGPGIANVRIRVVALAQQPADGFFAVQVGAFKDKDNAERVRAEMADRHGSAILQFRDGNPPLWRVLVGREATQEAAAALAAQVNVESGRAFVVRVDPAETN